MTRYIITIEGESDKAPNPDVVSVPGFTIHGIEVYAAHVPHFIREANDFKDVDPAGDDNS